MRFLNAAKRRQDYVSFPFFMFLDLACRYFEVRKIMNFYLQVIITGLVAFSVTFSMLFILQKNRDKTFKKMERQLQKDIESYEDI
jgi:hypothetical protein